MEGPIEFVTNLSLFLEKSEYGINHVYQLHQQLGGVFIDASFQDDVQKLIFKTRIEIVSPRLLVSELKWDDFGFPYELETYDIGEKEIEVPLYRPLGAAFQKFVSDIVEQMLTDTSIDAPTDLITNCHVLQKIMNDIRVFIANCKAGLDTKEQLAVDTFCGDIDLASRNKYDIEEALATYICNKIIKQASKYYEKMEKANEQRHEILLMAVSELVNNIENTLKKHNFKKGFVSN